MPPGAQAWHEAGHALAAHIQGGHVREVTLESDLDGLEGHVAVEWRLRGVEDEPRRLATVALAGPVAELIFLGQGALTDQETLASWGNDWAEAQAQLTRMHADAPSRESSLQEILRDLHGALGVGRGYERLARVADALDAHGTLDENLFEEARGDDESS